jgi:hypothetical protein
LWRTAVWGGKLTGLATTSPVDQPKTPSVQAKRSPDPLSPLKTTDVPLFLVHVSSVNENNEGSDEFGKYLPIRINNYTCSAFVDSGNVWRNAISKDIHGPLLASLRAGMQSENGLSDSQKRSVVRLIENK